MSNLKCYHRNSSCCTTLPRSSYQRRSIMTGVRYCTYGHTLEQNMIFSNAVIFYCVHFSMILIHLNSLSAWYLRCVNTYFLISFLLLFLFLFLFLSLFLFLYGQASAISSLYCVRAGKQNETTPLPLRRSYCTVRYARWTSLKWWHKMSPCFSPS